MTTPVGKSPRPFLPTEPWEVTYVIRTGDTLTGIARRFGLALADILKANPLIEDPNRIHVGQQLKLPAAGSPLAGAEWPAADPTRGLDVFERMPSCSATSETASPRAAPASDPPGAAGSGFLSKIKAFFDTLFGTGKAQTGPAAMTADAKSAPKLRLGPNEMYREAILLGSQRAGIDPAALAALIDAEAGKVKGPALNRLTDDAFYARHPELNRRPLTKADTELIEEWKKIRGETSGTWDPTAVNDKTTATGLTQFLADTWLGEAMRPGTHLNGVAKERGLVGLDNKVLEKDDLLALRTDPTLSIVAAADYGKGNLDELVRRGLVPEGATDRERAKLIYLAHHEGLRGAQRILKNTLTDDQAGPLLEANVPKEQRAELVEKHGGEAEAYKAWLWDYIDRKIDPDRFR